MKLNQFKKDNHIKTIESFRRAKFIECVEVIACSENSCGYCRSMDGRVFKLDDLPEMPFEKCTNDLGCRCVVIAVITGPDGKRIG